THTGQHEYGRTSVIRRDGSDLLADLPAELDVWMSHRDEVSRAPAGFATIAASGSAIAAFENPDAKLAGVQWHPEDMHTEDGQTLLERFLVHYPVYHHTSPSPAIH